MRIAVLKLDDIGRELHGAVLNAVSWALLRKIPISIGVIGTDLKSMPVVLVELIKVGCLAGMVELWNHGFRHIRYDQHDIEQVEQDLVQGHEAIHATFGIAPAGFGFPFNKYTDETVALVRARYPDYFIYELDFKSAHWISPEFNSFADGQPRFSYFKDRMRNAGEPTTQQLILQAHPPRWTDVGFADFERCVDLLTENGYVILSGADAMGVSGQLTALRAAQAKLVEGWRRDKDKYIETLSNFDSYFLRRFTTDFEKNYVQTRRILYPFVPKRVLDIGCGLGNWSLSFGLAGDSSEIILNDVNATIARALRSEMATLNNTAKVVVDERDLLSAAQEVDYKVDLLVSANTFNYLDPVQFFALAQKTVVAGGRMLLMVQTPAFNLQRQRIASESGDNVLGAEVLGSELGMLLRRQSDICLKGVRHVFSMADINALAAMFDFTPVCSYYPVGEHKEAGYPVYECYVFKRTTGMRNAISTHPSWPTECEAIIRKSFGSQAFELAGLVPAFTSVYDSFYGNWTVPAEAAPVHRTAALAFKDAIQRIRDHRKGSRLEHVTLAEGHAEYEQFCAKLNAFIDILNTKTRTN